MDNKITKLKFHAQYIKHNLGIHIIILLCFVLPALLLIDYTHEYEAISSMKIGEATVEVKRKAGKLLKVRKEINLIQYKFGVNGEIITTACPVGIKKWNKLKEGDKIKIEVISAREVYGEAFPKDSKRWKVESFLNLKKKFLLAFISINL